MQFSENFQRVHLRSHDYMYQMNTYSVTMLLYFNIQPPPQIISPFHKEDETKSNEQKVNDSMAAVKKMIAQEDTWILRARTEGARERLVPSQVVQYPNGSIQRTCFIMCTFSYKRPLLIRFC